MRILFIGDVFGSAGRRVLAQGLEKFIAQESIDLCIANGENVAGGRGITHNHFRKLHKYGVEVVTGGNHSFFNPDINDDLVSEPALLRPLNYPPGNIGHGKTLFTTRGGVKVGVINLQGRVFSAEQLDCPFRCGVAAIEELRAATPVIIVDFHGEATSEKIAFAHHVDGTVSAVLGTHTHVQTADERILNRGTAFISDVGMTGPENSAIGVQKEIIIQRFLLQTHVRFDPSELGPMLNAVIIDVDVATGKATAIRRVYERVVLL
jgi:metallophosphoesterase (TIGR00282 family)